MQTLSADAVDEFVRAGYVVLRGAFPVSLAERIVPLVWAEAAVDPHDPATWPGPTLLVETLIEADPVPAMFGPRYLGAFDDLCGAGRWRASRGAGYWPIRFPGFASPPWSPPTRGWHFDMREPPFRLGHCAPGLIALELFSEIGHGDGGTVVRSGSHAYVAHILAGAGPHGLDEPQLTATARAATAHLPVVEITGAPGDVVLMHPYTLHAASANVGTRVRILSHKPVWVDESLTRTPAEGEDRWPVERAIAEALKAAPADA